MRATFDVDARARTINVRNAAGEKNDGSRARIAISWHERSLELQERTVELTLPGRFQKRRSADQICRPRIKHDLQLVDLGPDNDLRFRALEFRAQCKGVAVGYKHGQRRRVAQHRAADQRHGIAVRHDALTAAYQQRNHRFACNLPCRTEMKVCFFSCHSRYMKFSKSYLSSMNRQRK